MFDDPHSRALRRGRWKLLGPTYFITTSVEGRRPLLGPLEGALVLDALQFLRRGGRARLYAFVIMPDHVHLMIEPLGQLISEVMKSWKNFSARQIQSLHGTRGTFWQHGFYDHLLRDDRELFVQLRYLQENPVRRGLVLRPEDFDLSSANPLRAHLVDSV